VRETLPQALNEAGLTLNLLWGLIGSPDFQSVVVQCRVLNRKGAAA